MAAEYGITYSDLFNEIAEWVLDQEDDFRKDLEEELGISEAAAEEEEEDLDEEDLDDEEEEDDDEEEDDEEL